MDTTLLCVYVCFQVVALVNDGSHEFFTKVSPRQGLCAGNWHRITGEDFLVNTEKLLKETMKEKNTEKSKNSQHTFLNGVNI